MAEENISVLESLGFKLQDDVDVAPDRIEEGAIEEDALEKIQNQFQVKRDLFNEEKEALLLRAKSNDDDTAIEQIEQRFSRMEKYNTIREELELDLFNKQQEYQKQIDATDDENEKNRLRRLSIRASQEAKFDGIKSQAAERYEATETKIGNIIDDITDPIKFIKRKAKEAAILTVAHLMKMRHLKDENEERVSAESGTGGGFLSEFLPGFSGGNEQPQDGGGFLSGLFSRGGDEQTQQEPSVIGTISAGMGMSPGDNDDQFQSNAENYHGKMLGFMNRLTLSTEESTKEQITQNKKDSRVSAGEESSEESMLGEDGPLSMILPKPKKEKKNPLDMLSKMKDMMPKMPSMPGGMPGMGGALKAAGPIGLGLAAAAVVQQGAAKLMSEEGGGSSALALNRMNTDDKEVVDLEMFGPSIIKDWPTVEALPVHRLQGLINYNDWDDPTLDRFKKIRDEKIAAAKNPEKNLEPKIDELDPKKPMETKSGKAAGAVEIRALESAKEKGEAQTKDGGNMLNAPTTNITNNTIEDRSFNNDPTIQQLNPWAVRGQYG